MNNSSFVCILTLHRVAFESSFLEKTHPRNMVKMKQTMLVRYEQ